MDPTTLSEATISAYKPSLWLLWSLSVLAAPLFTWLFRTRKTNWGRFVYVWLFSSVLTLIFVLIAVNYPAHITKFVEVFSNSSS